MLKIDMNGWDNLRKEGLQELKRLISVANSEGKENIVWALQAFHDAYEEERENQLQFGTLSDLEPRATVRDIKNKTRHDYENFRNAVKKLKQWLLTHYKTVEGKNERYKITFIERRGKVPLLDVKDSLDTEEKLIRKKSKKPKPVIIPEDVIIKTGKQSWDQRLRKWIWDTVIIYPEVWKAFPCSEITHWIMEVKIIRWVIKVLGLSSKCEFNKHTFVHKFNQDDIINRVKNSSSPTINALLAFILSLSVMVLFFWHFISQAEIIPCSPFVAFWQDLLVRWVKGRVLNILMPGAIILYISGAVSSFVLYLIYKLIGGKAGYYELLNLNVYYFSAWIVFIAKGALIGITPMNLTIKNILAYIFLSILIYALLSYVTTLNKLMAVSNKKGVPAFVLYIMIHFFFIKPLF